MTDAGVEALVDRVEELLRRQIGLRPDSTLRGRLRRSLRDEAATHDQTPDQFVDAVSARPGTLQGLLDRVTVQETGFFRHPDHFRVLAETVLPALTPPVTLWSAASSHGQEAYSLAIVLSELGIEGSVVATDLSTAAVRRTAAGRYSGREMAGLSRERVDRHFTADGDGWQVVPALRQRVSAQLHNLVGPIPDRVRGSQVVFCRNVLIYFSPEHAATFVDRMADAMPGAAVFLGGAEAMWPLSRRYETVRAGDTFWYRLAATPAAIPPTTAPAPRAASGPATPVPPVPRRPSSPPSRPSGRAAGPSLPLPVPPRSVPVTSIPSRRPAPDATVPADLALVGRRALDDGDPAAAVVAFRKCAYLTPEDPVAHLHLALALESAGDAPAARRAYGAARRALLGRDPAAPAPTLGGYAPAELLRLLDAKRQE